MILKLEASSHDSHRPAFALRKRILIVDDHQVVRHGTRAMLGDSHPNWEVCGEAANGEAAVEAIKRLVPDIVVLDVTMPGMSGFEVARLIKELGYKTRIVMFSMHNSPGFIGEARYVGADGYVLKSQAGRDLVKAIESILSGGTSFPSHSGGV
jgi:DNA-binding NarL/FixJ family response regulator